MRENNIEHLEILLEVAEQEREERVQVRLDFIETDDIARTAEYLAERWSEEKYGYRTAVIHPTPLSQLYKAVAGSYGRAYESLVALAEAYTNVLVIVHADYKNINGEGIAALRLFLVENEPHRELQRAWQRNNTRFILLSTEEDMNWYCGSTSNLDLGLVRPPAMVFQVNWK